MKLSRRFLVLAAALAAAPLARADVTVNYASPLTNPAQVLVGAPLTGVVNLTNLSAPGTLPAPSQIQELTRTITSLNLSQPVGAVRTQLIVDQQVAATTQIKLLSDDFTSVAAFPVTDATIADVVPLFIKTGGGTLQYDAFKDINYFGNNTFTNNSSLPNDLRSQGAFSGIAIVNQGSLVVSGYLNQWAQYGGFAPAGFTARMVGAKAVIVQGNSTLSFQNTPYNVVRQGPQLGDGQLGNPSSPLVYRLNFVHNLYAGTLLDFVNGNEGSDVNTVLEVGKDADYALNAHFDAGMVGSIGRIDGAGRLYKTGTGQLTILNSSRLTGDVFIAGGDLVLNDPNGLALRQAASVNLIGGSPDGQTALSEFNSATDDAGGTEWRPGYLPAGGAPVLEVRSNQTIRNLQALFAEAAVNLWDAGPGTGSRIDVSPNQRLVVIQDANLDGYYTGSINGGQGVFDKQGAGALALMGTSSTIGQIDVNGGKIIANVQSLGYGRVVLGAAGTLSIVQNNAGTLRAQINGAAGSVLTVAPTDGIVNTRSGNTTIGNGQLGVIDVYNRQDLFYGQLVVRDGITLAFSFGQDDTFVNASSIVLSSGVGDNNVNGGLGYETTIRFNDTTQRVNNLVGDANTRIELGRGSITLNQNTATTYQGKVTGAGNLVKQGANTLTLSGLNTYYGATVVKQGSLALTGANSIQNTAGLVLLAGATLNATGNQTVGSLFGQAGSTINLNGGTLIVGKTTDQIAELNAALTNFPGASPDANPAYYLQTTPTISAAIALPWGAAGTNTVSVASVAGLSAGSPVNGIDPTAPVGSGAFIIRPIGAGAALTNTITLADVSNLSVGQAVGTIPIVKPINTSSAAGAVVSFVTVGNTNNLAAGQTVTGLGIAAGTTIQSIVGNRVNLSAPLTAASSGLLTVATGIPAGTTIQNIDLGTNTLTLSNVLTAQAAGSLTASQPTLVVADASRLAVGQTVYSEALRKALVPGNINAGFVTVADVTGLAVGQMVTGVGIPAGTTITGFAGNDVLLSATTTAATSGTLTVLTGVPTGAHILNVDPLTNTVTLDTNLLAPASGELAIRSGITPGSVITGIKGNVLTLDTPLSFQSAGDLTNLPVAGMSRDNTVGYLASTLGEQVVRTVVAGAQGGTTLALSDVTGLAQGRTILGAGIPAGASITGILAAGSATITGTILAGQTVLPTADTAGLTVGQIVTGAGIPANTVITAIAPNASITLSNALLTNSSGVVTGLAGVTLSQALTAPATGSVRVLTVADQQVLSFRGNITGTGGLTKIGPERLILAGVSNYSGATNIQGGVLQINGGSLPNTSGINIGALGALAINIDAGTLEFNRPITGVGGFEKLGAGTLVINTTTGWSTGRIDIIEGAVQFNPGNLSSITGGIVNVRAGTNFQLNTPNDLAWTGSISGPGNTSKTGAGTLTIGGSFTATGTMSVLAGKVVVNALPKDATLFGTIDVTSGTTFADKVAATTASQLLTGTFVPVGSVAGFYVGQRVTGAGIAAGSVVVAVGTDSLTLDLPTTAVANQGVVGAETYGAQVSRAATQAVAGASVSVPTAGLQAGMRVYDNTVAAAPVLLGTIAAIVDANTLTLSAATTVARNGAFAFYQGDIRGAGNFEKTGGGLLQLDVPLSLTGAVNLTGGTLKLNTAATFATATAVNLGANTTLDVSGFSQDLANVTGDASSTIDGTGAVLTINVTAATTAVYRGNIVGGATIDKLGSGTFNLARLGTTNVIGAINAKAGTLIGSQAGFGAANLFVDNGAIIGFNNDDPTLAWTYAGQVTSTGVGTGTAGGTILKTGAGEVRLTNPGNTAENYVVQGGKLRISDGRANGLGNSVTAFQGVVATNTTELFTANQAANTTLQIELGNGAQRAMGAQITAAAGSSLILDAAGTAAVALTAAPQLASIGLQGNVVLWTNGQTQLVGVEGSAGSTLRFSAAPASAATTQAVTLRQSLATTMLGTIESEVATDLTLVGPARASLLAANFPNSFLGVAGLANTLTVGSGAEAGHIEILPAFQNKTLTLVSGSAVPSAQSSVAVRADGGSYAAPEEFFGLVGGAPAAGRFIKTGAGYLDGRTASVTAPVFSSYEIEAGHFIVESANGSILGGRPITLKGGFLEIQQGAGAATLATGAFAASSGTGLIQVDGAPGSGVLTIGGSFAGGLALTGEAKVTLGTTLAPNVAISGEISVGSTSTLRGSAILGTLAAPADFINNGIVAPGYSPGVITVTGDVTNTGTYQLELSATEANGTFNDRIEFYGSADLNVGGTGQIELSRFGAGALPPGRRFVLFQGLTPATVGVAGGAAGRSFLATANLTGLRVGDGLAGTGLAAGTSVSAVVPSVGQTATGGNGSEVFLASAAGFVLGQVVSGTGIAAGSVITQINGTTLTLDRATTATPAGTITGAAGVSLSAALTAAPVGTVAITPSTRVASYYTSVIPAASVSIIGRNPYLLSTPEITKTVPTLTLRNATTLVLNNTTGLVVGQPILGVGIPAGTAITKIDAATSTVTLSNALTADLSGGIALGLVTGVPVSASEIAVYAVRPEAAYEAFSGPAALKSRIQALTRLDETDLGGGAYRYAPAATFNLLGAKLALMSDAQLQAAINNLTPFGAASAAAMSIEGFRSSEALLAKRLEMRRFDRAGLSIVNSEWFVGSDIRQLSLGASGELKTKGNLMGVHAGLIRQTDEGANYGFTLGANRVTTTGDTSAKFEGNDIRADVFAGTTFYNDLMSLDLGFSVGRLSGETRRDSVMAPGVTNVASPTATTIGGWARLGTVLPLKAVGAYATPFLGVQVSSTSLSSLAESGQTDALEVTAKTIAQTSLRAGVGFHKQWESEDGTWRYRFSADLGYLNQGSGETSDFTATNADPNGLNGQSYTSALRVTGGSGYYFAPSFNFGPNENTTYTLGLTYEKNQGTGTGFNFSYRKRF
ncbi:MAG: autotransporter-associated beta strand repeat-containing protein [Opitutia bacterium]